jgi:hypothetical protein
MEYILSIGLTKNQYDVLKTLAQRDYRTMGNAFAMLAVHGLGFYLTDHDIAVKKTEADRDPNGKEYQYYTDQELEEVFEFLPLHQ